jgi:hypothetical protein
MTSPEIISGIVHTSKDELAFPVGKDRKIRGLLQLRQIVSLVPMDDSSGELVLSLGNSESIIEEDTISVGIANAGIFAGYWSTFWEYVRKMNDEDAECHNFIFNSRGSYHFVVAS